MTKIPPFVVFSACLLLMSLLPTVLPFPNIKIISVLLGIVAVALGCTGIYQIRQANTTINPFNPERATTIVQSGVYRLSRNPMYLSLALALIAYVGWLGNTLALVGVVLFVSYMNLFQINSEEQALTKKFGEHYLAYQHKVRRWI